MPMESSVQLSVTRQLMRVSFCKNPNAVIQYSATLSGAITPDHTIKQRGPAAVVVDATTHPRNVVGQGAVTQHQNAAVADRATLIAFILAKDAVAERQLAVVVNACCNPVAYCHPGDDHLTALPNVQRRVEKIRRWRWSHFDRHGNVADTIVQEGNVTIKSKAGLEPNDLRATTSEREDNRIIAPGREWRQRRSASTILPRRFPYLSR